MEPLFKKFGLGRLISQGEIIVVDGMIGVAVDFFVSELGWAQKYKSNCPDEEAFLCSLQSPDSIVQLVVRRRAKNLGKIPELKLEFSNPGAVAKEMAGWALIRSGGEGSRSVILNSDGSATVHMPFLFASGIKIVPPLSE